MSSNREVIDRFYADTRAVLRNLAREYPYIRNLKEINHLIDEQ